MHPVSLVPPEEYARMEKNPEKGRIRHIRHTLPKITPEMRPKNANTRHPYLSPGLGREVAPNGG